MKRIHFHSKLFRYMVLYAATLYLIRSFSVPSAAEEAITALGIAPFVNEAEDADFIYWLHKDFSVPEAEEETREPGMYFLFLPADTDLAAAKVYYQASDPVLLDGTEVASGEAADRFTEGEHTITCGDKTFSLTVCMSANIPSVFLITQSGTLDAIHKNKEYMESASMRMYEKGSLVLEKDLAYMKGRGNASFLGSKKSYSIKFKKKTDLCGMGKAKGWNLISNDFDRSLLGNVYGWEFAKAFGLEFTSDYRHVDLYVNGIYLGNYVICEKVEIGENRVDLRDLEKENENANDGVNLSRTRILGNGEDGAVSSGSVPESRKWADLPAEPEDVSGGYLLEIEIINRYDEERCGFVTKDGTPIVIKEPENAGRRETEYISSLVNAAFEALHSPDGCNEEGRHYTELFDMDSFVNMYILQELSNNLDAGITSTYMYKDTDSEKLCFSPVWDMDHAFGGSFQRFEVNINREDIWWANSMSYPNPTPFTAAYRHEDFREAVRRRWEELVAEGVLNKVGEEVYLLSRKLAASGTMNMLRWGKDIRVSEAEEKYFLRVSAADETFIPSRIEALSRGFSEEAAMLCYDANGGSGYLYHRKILLIGETAEVQDEVSDTNAILPPDDLHRFGGWNTQPDGSGETYQPGDLLVLTSPVTTLYARWIPIEQE